MTVFLSQHTESLLLQLEFMNCTKQKTELKTSRAHTHTYLALFNDPLDSI